MFTPAQVSACSGQRIAGRPWAIVQRCPSRSRATYAQLVNARLERQAILAPGDPPLLWVVLDEGVLHREVGDSKLMSGQLLHLAEMSRRPNITVEAVPYSTGARWPAGCVRDRQIR